MGDRRTHIKSLALLYEFLRVNHSRDELREFGALR